MSKNVSMIHNTKERCFGCGACEAICPADAIQLHLDRDGFYYPQVDASRCFDCGKCLRVCGFILENRNSGRSEGD